MFLCFLSRVSARVCSGYRDRGFACMCLRLCFWVRMCSCYVFIFISNTLFLITSLHQRRSTCKPSRCEYLALNHRSSMHKVNWAKSFVQSYKQSIEQSTCKQIHLHCGRIVSHAIHKNGHMRNCFYPSVYIHCVYMWLKTRQKIRRLAAAGIAQDDKDTFHTACKKKNE